MAEYPTMEDILALNPHIDEEKLEKAREILRKLRDSRTRRSGYSLAPPFVRRPISVGEGDKVDSRTIRLGRLRR